MRLVEIVQCRVPPGTTFEIVSIAERDGVSPSEVLRRAILESVSKDARLKRAAEGNKRPTSIEAA